MTTTTHQLQQPRIEGVKTFSPFHQRITLGPFERGYGHTLGNAIRRVLLSSMPGYAATEVVIDGVKHQYSSIAGVTEDVIEIILNIKEVAFRIEGAERATVEIDKTGPCVVTAGDIQLPGQMSIINPDQHIATVARDSKLAMKITVEAGRGYQTAGVAGENKPFGTLLLDAAFTPVRNVAIEIESTRVDNRTDLDRLVIDLKTNGIHNPEEMIRYAARTLVNQLSLFADLDVDTVPLDKIGVKQQAAGVKYFADSIDLLADRVNVRIINNLKQENIFFIGDLVGMSEKELLKTPRLGKKTVDEIKLALSDLELELGMDTSSYNPEQTV